LPDIKAVNVDTVLTPRAVFDRNLDFTGSHVSMTACVRGPSREGLGLEWAFIQNGAASVLSPHWDVSARYPATFLEMFYERGLGDPQARAQAMSTAITGPRSAGGRAGGPSSLGAFLLTGDWR